MPGIRADQQALYVKDMYKAEREGFMEEEVMYSQVYSVVNGVTGAGDKATQILGAGNLRRHTVENDKIQFKSPVEGWSYYVKYHTFSDGIALSKEAVEDTVKLGNLLKDLARTWGKSVRLEKETVAARVFNQGGALAGDWVFNGTHVGNSDPQGDLLYDGYPLFNLTGNARSTKGGGTYYNSVAGLTLTPSDFETIYNLHTATNNRDERDRVVKNPADTLLVSPGADMFLAERLLNTQAMPSSQLNDVNPYYKIVTPMDWDYLNDSAFYLGKRKHSSFQFHERQAPEIRFFRDEDDLGYKASINLRFGVMVKDWRCWTRGGGSSS